MPDHTIYNEYGDRFASRCRADSPPIDLDLYIQKDLIVDADGIHYTPWNGQPLYRDNQSIPTRYSNGRIEP